MATRIQKWKDADDDNRGGGRCWGAINPAIYIPCPLCSTTRNPTWGSFDCCVNDTMDETDWTQRIFDTQTGIEILIDEVIYNNDIDWPTARPGYPYHLIQKTYPNEAGSNWLQSCYEWGTPGADPLDFCPPRCDTASCRAGGDTSATCSGNGICFCTAPTFYANGISCKRIPVIRVCEGLWLKINETEYVMQFKWSGVLFADKEYVLTYQDKTFGTNATVSTSQTAFDVTDEEIAWNGINVPPSVVAVRVIDEAGNAVTGLETICTIITPPPSEAPTRAPTSPPTPLVSVSPSKQTEAPTKNPTKTPTTTPTTVPTETPSLIPSHSPTQIPTVTPSNNPTINPMTDFPTIVPTETPSKQINQNSMGNDKKQQRNVLFAGLGIGLGIGLIFAITSCIFCLWYLQHNYKQQSNQVSHFSHNIANDPAQLGSISSTHATGMIALPQSNMTPGQFQKNQNDLYSLTEGDMKAHEFVTNNGQINHEGESQINVTNSDILPSQFATIQ